MLKIVLINTMTLLRIPLAVAFCGVLLSDNPYEVTVNA